MKRITLPPYTDQLDSERKVVRDELAAKKAHIIGHRPVWRDYVDIFVFLKWYQYTIDVLICLAEKKFAGEFNPKLFLQQLVYFSDLKIADTPFLKESFTPEEIKSFLSDEVEKYLKKVLPI